MNPLIEQKVEEFKKRHFSVTGGINPWKFKSCTPTWQELEKIGDELEVSLRDALTSLSFSITEQVRADAFMEGLKRHTWMKDGVTYVGNGFYTLKEAIKLAERDGLLSPKPSSEDKK